MNYKINFRTLKKLDQIFLIFGVIIFLIVFLFASKFQYSITNIFFKSNYQFLDKDIIVVALDKKTLNSEKFKRYQDITRCDYTELLKNIEYGEPKVIGVDVFFDQESRDKLCDKGLIDFMNDNDNIILGTEYVHEIYDVKKNLFGLDDNLKNIAYVDTDSFNDLNILGSSSNIDYKNKIPIYFRGENSVLPLSFEMYKKAFDKKMVSISDNEIKFDDKKIPLKNNYVDINFFTPEYKTVSFIDVIENNVDNEIFKNKIVFVGATASDIHDEFLTPYSTTSFIPGVMIHANMYNSLSKNKLLIYENLWVLFTINLILFLIFIFILLNTKNIFSGISYSFLALIIFIIISVIVFNQTGYFTEVFPSVILFGFANLLIYLKKYFEEKKSKDEVRTMFSRYISEDVVNELIKNGTDDLKLGGFEREISVFFSDIVGFTELSENLKPDELGYILNIYFEEMSGIILKEKGTIDKFIGDAIMAFWNAPLDLPKHANNACTAALLQREALKKVGAKIKELGCDTVIDMRIGINSGNAVVGNFGCSRRYDYTALGDTVNLASRLESINKQYGTNIIISESTYDSIGKDRFIVRELDLITVKGKTKPVKIYELLGHKNLNEAQKINLYKEALEGYKNKKYSESIDKFKKIWDIPSQNFVKKLKEIQKVELFNEAYNLYKSAEFAKAKIIFEKIGDNPSKNFIERCEEFIKNPPGAEWDGVYRFKVK